LFCQSMRQYFNSLYQVRLCDGCLSIVRWMRRLNGHAERCSYHLSQSGKTVRQRVGDTCVVCSGTWRAHENVRLRSSLLLGMIWCLTSNVQVPQPLSQFCWFHNLCNNCWLSIVHWFACNSAIPSDVE
jgi:hypothetical protein